MACNQSKIFMLFSLLLAFSALVSIVNFSLIRHITSKDNKSLLKQSNHNDKLMKIIQTMDSMSILTESKFAKFHKESMRFLGNQQRMLDLLSRIFSIDSPTLNIAIIGGSISLAEVRLVTYTMIFSPLNKF